MKDHFSYCSIIQIGNSAYKYFRTDSVDDSIDVGKRDSELLVCLIKRYEEKWQKITVDVLKTKPYVLGIEEPC